MELQTAGRRFRPPNTVFDSENRRLERSIDNRFDRYEYRSNLGQWCEVTGWHGVVDAYRAKHTLVKIIWVVLILFSLLLTINQCLALMLDFVSDDQWITSTTFETSEDEALEWPNITVSNMDLFLISQLQILKFMDPYRVAHMKIPDLDAVAFFDEMQAADPIGNKNLLQQRLDEMNNFAAVQIGNFTWSDLYATFTVKCDEIAIHCGSTAQFDLRKKVDSCCDQQTAFLNLFSISSTAIFGKCMKTGRDSSVYILLNPRTNDYYNYIMKNELPTAGLRLQLFFGESDAAEQSELLLSPGTHAMLSMVKQKYRTVERRSRTVNFDPARKKPCNDTISYQHYDYGTYSSKLCALDCMTHEFMRICNCTLIDTRAIKTKEVTLCAGYQIVLCSAEWTKVQLLLQSNGDNEAVKSLRQCWKRCGEACEYDTVDVRLSTAVFPASAKTQAFTTYLNRAFKYRNLNFTIEETKQLIFLEMFYETKQIRVIERINRSTLAELISNIGGAMGVWTGLSILSLFECLVFALKGLFGGKQ